MRKIRDNLRKIEFHKINREKIKFEIKKIDKKTSEVIINIYTIFFIIEILYKERITLIVENLKASITYNIIFINNFFDVNIIFIEYYI